MKAKNRLLVLLYLLSAFAVIASGYSLYICRTVKPPVENIHKARVMLASAKEKLAGKYAGDLLEEAESSFEEAMKEWKKQNNAFFIVRDYSLADELAWKSYNRSLAALDETAKAKNKLRYNAENKLDKLNKKINFFERHYEKLALNPSTHKLFVSGKTRFAEAEIEFKAEEYLKAVKHLLEAEEVIARAEKQAHLKLAEFYRNYPEWERNTRMAYQLSKNGQMVFLIDKLDASLILLKSGKEYRKFHVEFGNNWMSDKVMSDDKATPEGVYKVQEKKSRSNTKYYKALLINYPNKEDHSRYNKLVKSGRISKSNGIGSLIEIHGEGGKGIHWTDGCIAVENSEMDYVFSQCSVNTPVIIVGARQTLEEYLN